MISLPSEMYLCGALNPSMSHSRSPRTLLGGAGGCSHAGQVLAVGRELQHRLGGLLRALQLSLLSSSHLVLWIQRCMLCARHGHAQMAGELQRNRNSQITRLIWLRASCLPVTRDMLPHRRQLAGRAMLHSEYHTTQACMNLTHTKEADGVSTPQALLATLTCTGGTRASTECKMLSCSPAGSRGTAECAGTGQPEGPRW